MLLLSPLIEEAVELAAQWHDGTYRKGRWRDAAFSLEGGALPGVPVIAHLVNVAIVVQRAGWDDATVAAALLHDLIEDGNLDGEPFNFADLVERIGAEVAHRVMEVTERVTDDDGRRRSWQERKVDYVKALESASSEAVAISLADKLHNLWTITRALERGIDVFADGPGRRRLGAGPERQAWFVREVLRASESAADARLEALRSALLAELEHFDRAIRAFHA